jgi:hypothetical protein
MGKEQDCTMKKFCVTFTVIVEAEDKQTAYTIAANAVEGFPPKGVIVSGVINEEEGLDDV